jgi:phosphoribosylaminoimidazolecarboxamide formyltransferase/IMP cyclohydrolase
VTLVCNPADYSAVLDELRAGGVTSETRRRLAVKGFASTAHYDSAIFAYLSGRDALHVTAYPVQALRYGENPHQSATLYSYDPNGGGPLGGKVLQGKELSYNNLLDLDAAWKGAVSFERPAIVIVKHLSPCGIATGDRLVDAFESALASDPISAFGGVIASNQPFDRETAEALGDLFVECIAAPGFTADAQAILATRKHAACRLVEIPDLKIDPAYELRTINRGLLKQDIDLGDPASMEWKVVSKRQPTEAEWSALKFAWKACQHVKSNAIVFARDEATVGIGGGQPNRVDCVRIAAERAGEKSKGAVMASDVSFPIRLRSRRKPHYGHCPPGGSGRRRIDRRWTPTSRWRPDRVPPHFKHSFPPTGGRRRRVCG